MVNEEIITQAFIVLEDYYIFSCKHAAELEKLTKINRSNLKKNLASTYNYDNLPQLTESEECQEYSKIIDKISPIIKEIISGTTVFKFDGKSEAKYEETKLALAVLNVTIIEEPSYEVEGNQRDYTIRYTGQFTIEQLKLRMSPDEFIKALKEKVREEVKEKYAQQER